MKRFTAIIIAVLVAAMCLSCLVSAEMGPIGDDLLENSGLGDFEYIYEENIKIDAGTWVGHEDWNPNQGWDGFLGGSDYGAGTTTRTIVDNAEKGKVLRIAAPEDIHSGSETAIENIDLICEFEVGKSYVAVIEYRTDHAWCNGHELCFDFGKHCTHNDQEFTTDGQWHTIQTPVLEYTQDIVDAGLGYGHYLYMAACENWWSAGDYLEIASVKVYEYGEVPAATGDTALVVVAVIAVALAASVVFSKKKAF